MDPVNLHFPNDYHCRAADFQKLESKRDWAKFYAVIKYVGLAVAMASAVGGLVLSSPVFFAGAAITALGAAVLSHVLRVRKLSQVRQLEKNKELLPEARAELCAELFLKNCDKKFGFFQNLKLICETGLLYPSFIREYYDSTKESSIPHFAIADRSLKQSTRIGLMQAAIEKGFVIHFKTLEKPFVRDAELDKLSKQFLLDRKPLKEAVDSVSLSLELIKSFLEEEAVPVERVNRQLHALSPKLLCDVSEARKSFPLVQLEDPKTIAITSYCGESGGLKDILDCINVAGITIKLYGPGFKIYHSCGFNPESWKRFLEGATHKLSFQPTVEDCTDQELPQDFFYDRQSRYPLQLVGFVKSAQYLYAHSQTGKESVKV